jgi:hypothetical protein
MDVDKPRKEINNLQNLTTALRAAETDWKGTATLLVAKVHDKANELHLDLNDTCQTEYELTMEIQALKAEGKLQRITTVEEEKAMLLRLYVLEKKLAALRDLGHALRWVRADDRAVHLSPTSSCELPGAGEWEFETTVGSTLEMVAVTVKLSKKLALLKDEVRKVNDAAATLEDLDWQSDEAPLTVMLLFS